MRPLMSGGSISTGLCEFWSSPVQKGMPTANASAPRSGSRTHVGEVGGTEEDLKHATSTNGEKNSTRCGPKEC